MFQNTYSVSFFYSETLYRLPDGSLPDLPESTNSKVLVISKTVSNPTEKEINFLNNILKAIGLTSDKVLVIFLPVSDVLSFANIIRKYEPDTLICFGFSSTDLQLNISTNLYQPIVLINTTLILADLLNVLESDHHKKTLLWQQLKRIFKL
ncbi:MAG: hypothetical protein IPM47_15250 [Sphingobacteriales bacterium]|nr:MAG: hypothetical protein IPM47_15250 [Sphingobacteriales bacterium]